MTQSNPTSVARMQGCQGVVYECVGPGVSVSGLDLQDAGANGRRLRQSVGVRLTLKHWRVVIDVLRRKTSRGEIC